MIDESTGIRTLQLGVTNVDIKKLNEVQASLQARQAFFRYVVDEAQTAATEACMDDEESSSNKGFCRAGGSCYLRRGYDSATIGYQEG